MNHFGFLDTHVSLAPTHVSLSVRWSVRPSHFRISNLSVSLVALHENVEERGPQLLAPPRRCSYGQVVQGSIQSGPVHPVQHIGLSVPICSTLFNNDSATPEMVRIVRKQSGNGQEMSGNCQEISGNCQEMSGNGLRWSENSSRRSGNSRRWSGNVPEMS